MRGIGTHGSARSPVPHGLKQGLAGVSLFLFTACGSELASQRGVTASALLSVSGGPVYDYGSVTVDTTVDRFFTVTNIGSRKATQITGSFYLSVNFSFTGGSFPGEGGTCGSDLAPQDTCTVAVRFYPRSFGSL